MKTLLIVLVIILFNSSLQSIDFYSVEIWKINNNHWLFNLDTLKEVIINTAETQDWMPLALGNKWQFISTSSSYPFTTQKNQMYIDSVSEKIIISNLEYFKIGPTVYRYDRDLKILFQRVGNEDKVIIDFTKNNGYQYQMGFYLCTIIEGGTKLFDTVHIFKGYSYVWIYGNGRKHYSRNIGMFNSYDWSDVSGQPPKEYTSYLIETVLFDSTGKKIYTYQNYPNIIINPIFKISNTIFKLDFSVNHNYTKNSLNFIDSVIMYSFYSKGDSIINIEPIMANNLPVNSNYYSISTNINLGLIINGFSYNYRILAKDKHLIPKYDFSPDSGYFIAIYDSTTDVKEEKEIKSINSFKLEQNYPNPFNPVTTINYQVPEKSFVTLKIFDILGNEVATLVNEEKQIGTYEVEFDTKKINVTSGIFFYQIRAGKFVETKKMLLVK